MVAAYDSGGQRMFRPEHVTQRKGRFPEKERVRSGYHMDSRKGGKILFRPWTSALRGNIDDVDDNGRDPKANCNSLVVVFMLSGFLNLGAPL